MQFSESGRSWTFDRKYSKPPTLFCVRLPVIPDFIKYQNILYIQFGGKFASTGNSMCSVMRPNETVY